MRTFAGWLFAGWLVGAMPAACARRPMASTAQCERLLNRYIDLQLSENRAAARMSSDDRARLRGKIAMDVLADPDVRQVKDRCQTDVTEAEYGCAVVAATSKAWNDCIQ